MVHELTTKSEIGLMNSKPIKNRFNATLCNCSKENFFSREKAMKMNILHMFKNGVICHVIEPMEWYVPMVAMSKPKGTLRSESEASE